MIYGYTYFLYPRQKFQLSIIKLLILIKKNPINCCLKKTNDFSMHLQKEIEVSYIFLKTEIFTFGACLEKKSIYS